jgi:hypothetical protein
MKKILTGFALLTMFTAVAQDSTTVETNKLTLTGYIEAYYGYDFNKPVDNNRPSFIYSHNRHNEFNVNLAFLKGSYSVERVRANLALAVGTYMNANYAAEPGVLKNIYEANAGVKLSKNANLWLDLGILPSHIGFESAISKDCWTLTRSMLADNTPYYESGARLSYTNNNGKLYLAAFALNGWQRITRVSGNSLMSWGTQITLKPSDKITFNYSTFFGSDKPDSARLWRIYHNLYTILQFNEKIGLTAGFDIGTEQKTKGNSEVNTWYSPVGILRLTPNDVWAIALRGEYFSDENGVIIPIAIGTATPNGFKTSGFSINVDRRFSEHFLWRIEFRNFKSKDEVFIKGDESRNNNSAITTSFALSF